MAKSYCIDCGKLLAKWKAVRCQKHANWIITRSFIGKKLSKEHKEKLKSSWDYTKHITPEWREKQSKLRKGKPVVPKGSKWTDEQRENMLKKRKYMYTDEWKEKVGASHRSEKAYQWKGGRIIQNGYIDILLEEKWPNGKKKYKREHRIVMENHLGRKLTRYEHVHHIDGNKVNNDIGNLMLFPNAKAHAEYHAKLLS